jgi:PAS domain S-box-containing protein
MTVPSNTMMSTGSGTALMLNNAPLTTTLFRRSPIGIMLYDANGSLVDVNEAALKIFGVEDLRSIEKYNLFANPDLDSTQLDMIRNGITVHYEAWVDFDETGRVQRSTSSRCGIGVLDYAIEPVRPDTCSVPSGFTVFVRDCTRQRWSESNLGQVVDVMNDLLVVMDREGRILAANDLLGSKLGYHPGELLNSDFTLLAAPGGKNDVARIIATVGSGVTETITLQLLTKDGLVLPAEFRANHGTWNGRDAIIGIVKDCSEIMASEEKCAAAFNTSPNLMALSDFQTGVLLDVNKAFASTLGYSRDELIGRTSSSVGLFANPDQRTEAMKLFREQGYLREYEASVRTRHGEIRYGLFSLEEIRLRDKHLLLTVMTDITSHRQAEDEMYDVTRQLYAVIETIGEGISVSDTSGYFNVFNSALGSITGYTLEEANNSGDFTRLLYPDEESRSRALTGLEPIIRDGKAHDVETTIRCKDGTDKTVLISSAMITFKSEQMFLSAWKDITERKRSEMEREQLVHDLQKALTEVKTLTGLLPICANCKKIRDDQGYWNRIESYLSTRVDVQFTHGVCPDCMKELYPQYAGKHLHTDQPHRC